MSNLNVKGNALGRLLVRGLLLCLVAVALPASAQDGDNDHKKNDNSRYLAGAVPEVDGKVVFSKEYSIPGMPQEEIYKRALSWLETRLAGVKFAEGHVVYQDAEKGDLVSTSRERLIFSQSALALDYAVMSYQLTLECRPERCSLAVEKVRYVYREGQQNQEKYTAEGWITDKYALNKSKTKLVLGLAKWRKKTVDRMDDLCEELAVALSTSAADKERALAAQAQEEEERARRRTGPIVVQQRAQVNMSDGAPAMAPTATETTTIAETTPATPATPPAVPADHPSAIPAEGNPVADNAPQGEEQAPQAPAEALPALVDGYETVSPDALSSDLIQMGAGRLVIAAGGQEITANAGGSLGRMSGQAVVFSFLSPDQAYEAVEAAQTYTVSFYPAGQERASVILECEKQPSQAPLEGQPRMYIGQITQAKVYRGE